MLYKLAVLSKIVVSKCLPVDANLHNLFESVSNIVTAMDLESVSPPRPRRSSARFSRLAVADTAYTAEQHYKGQYFEFMDDTFAQLTERFLTHRVNSLIIICVLRMHRSQVDYTYNFQMRRFIVLDHFVF